MQLKLNKNWVVFIVALAFGTLAAFVARHYIGQRIADIEAKEKNKETVQQVVAKKELDKGTVLSTENMAVREIPKEWAHSDGVTPDQFARIEGSKLAFPAKPGEPLIWSQLEGDKLPSFSTMLVSGRRAVTVPVDEISSLSGMVAPGDLIDIIVTTHKESKAYTFTLLQSVKVLATGTQIDNDKKDAQGNAMTYNTITLDTLPDEAKKIIAAREIGKVTALLRSPDDKQVVSTSRLDAAALLGLNGYTGGVSSVPVIYGGGPITQGLSMYDPKEQMAPPDAMEAGFAPIPMPVQ